MKVLVRRRANGIGDWLFLLTALKHANQQAPDIDWYVDFAMPGEPGTRVLPELVPQAFRASDVKWRRPTSGVEYALEIPHVVYPTRPRIGLYQEGMVAQLAALTGRPLEYDPMVRPAFVYPEWRERPASYVVIAPFSKRETNHKELGLAVWWRFIELIGTLREVVTVVQLGAGNETPLRGCVPALGLPFETVAGVLAGARAFVGLENGLAVLAGHIGIPHYVCYATGRDLGRLDGPLLSAGVRPPAGDLVAWCKGKLDAH